MAIQKLTVENFTVFEKMEIEFCDGVNVFIGENGTGKTHLLKVLYATLLDPNNRYEAGVLSPSTSLLNADDMRQSLFCRVFGSRGLSKIKPPKIFVEYSELKEPIFIPAKDVLSIARIATLIEKDLITLDIDKTLTDIIMKAQNYPLTTPHSELMKRTLPKLSNIIDGSIFLDEDKCFWIKKNDGTTIPLTMEAEGFKKIGLLSQLIFCQNINEETALLWDEPEANINPKLIPVIVDILLELSRHGVQIFLATHEYNIMKYFSMYKKSDDKVNFYSLYKTENGVAYECEDDYDLLENNPIVDAEIKMHRDEVEKMLGK